MQKIVIEGNVVMGLAEVRIERAGRRELLCHALSTPDLHRMLGHLRVPHMRIEDHRDRSGDRLLQSVEQRLRDQLWSEETVDHWATDESANIMGAIYVVSCLLKTFEVNQ